jgi:hypothetical protein
LRLYEITRVANGFCKNDRILKVGEFPIGKYEEFL